MEELIDLRWNFVRLKCSLAEDDDQASGPKRSAVGPAPGSARRPLALPTMPWGRHYVCHLFGFGFCSCGVFAVFLEVPCVWSVQFYCLGALCLGVALYPALNPDPWGQGGGRGLL